MSTDCLPMDFSVEIEQLIRETEANDGLAPLDVEKFWAVQDHSVRDPFGKSIPQLPLTTWTMSGDIIYDELGIPEDGLRYRQDDAWRVEVTRAYNDKAVRIVGRRLLNDTPADPERSYPPVKELHDVFEAAQEWQSGSWWLHQSANDADELARLLDRVEQRDVRSFILPAGWDAARTRLMAQGIRPPQYTVQRGPVTFATSIYGCENLIFLIMDQPELAIRFRNAILRVMLDIRKVLEEEAGFTRETAPRSFSFNDDNCYLLTSEMYEMFGFPILQGVFDYCAPSPQHRRYQHSDSAMGHLLPVLARLNLTGCNFGPMLSVHEIRAAMPGTVIDGQLDPMVYCRNDQREILRQLFRDFEQAREKRGLVFTTAGVVNNGTRLTSMRLIMAAIQRHCRYQ